MTLKRKDILIQFKVDEDQKAVLKNRYAAFLIKQPHEICSFSEFIRKTLTLE